MFGLSNNRNSDLVRFGGYHQSRDGRLQFASRIPNIAISAMDIYIEVGWKVDQRNRPIDGQARATLQGLGWATILDNKSSFFDGKFEIRDHQIIMFELRHTIAVAVPPVNPVMLAVKLEQRWPCIIRGVLDTRTDYFRAELEWR